MPFVAQCLAAHDPEHADEYSNNAKAYQAELESLETYVKETLATIPEPRRQLITAHDAFGYFSRAYNIPVHSVQGISTESEPGVNDINQLVDFIVTQKIPAIFVETGVNEANLRAVMEGAKSRGWNVQIGGRLYSDSMGPPGTYEGTYIGMIDHNTTVLARSLGGRASPGGWKGQLKLD